MLIVDPHRGRPQRAVFVYIVQANRDRSGAWPAENHGPVRFKFRIGERDRDHRGFVFDLQTERAAPALRSFHLSAGEADFDPDKRDGQDQDANFER